ncbi:hypothetical protein N5P37_002511 [Trichoderma harzianum]|nr:hypothetical protein N5P37_002511 [Trichoderma harzianum]
MMRAGINVDGNNGGTWGPWDAVFDFHSGIWRALLTGCQLELGCVAGCIPLPIDNSDDLRAALLIHRFSMCIRNQVFVDLKMLLYRLAHPFFIYADAESHERGRKRIFSIRLCYLPLSLTWFWGVGCWIHGV